MATSSSSRPARPQHMPHGKPPPSTRAMPPPGPATAQPAPSAEERQADERQQREERILDAAATLLVRWGFRKTTIDDVAREAGVGKGTIYLHWKDKTDLFLAAIWHASRQTIEDVMRRLNADPEGGRFYRLWTHGLLAVVANPLMAEVMKGRSDIFQGLMNSISPETVAQLVGNADTHVAQLKAAGLIRADLPVSTITYVMGALKLGIIHASDVVSTASVPSMEQLTEAISDLMRRWLEPEHPPADSAAGKHILAEWMEQSIAIGSQQQ